VGETKDRIKLRANMIRELLYGQPDPQSYRAIDQLLNSIAGEVCNGEEISEIANSQFCIVRRDDTGKLINRPVHEVLKRVAIELDKLDEPKE
jgi:hypothetical protein